MPELDQILAEIESAAATRERRRQWQPQQSGRIDIRISANGDWYHEGRRFQRDSMVRLFAGILRRERDTYYLVTPVEKLAIEVEDAPFIATLVEAVDDGELPAIMFTTNIGDRIVLSDENGLRIEFDPETDEPRPYLALHDGLEALISRSAFYDLLNLAEERQGAHGNRLVVTSMGRDFELGSSDE